MRRPMTMDNFVDSVEHLSAAYAALDIAPLTKQEEHFVKLRLRNLPPRACASRAGYPDPRVPMHNENIQAVIGYFQDMGEQALVVDKDLLTLMLFEAHSKAATATEEIAAIRELGKMHNVYEADKAQQGQLIRRVEQLERMSTEDLLQQVGDKRLGSLDPNDAIEAEYEEVDGEQDQQS